MVCVRLVVRPRTTTKVESCADPESFARGGSNFDNFFLLYVFFCLMREDGSKYHYKWADDGTTLNAGLVVL